MVMFQVRSHAGAFDRRSAKVGELEFDENFPDQPGRFLLCQIGCKIRKKFVHLLGALFQGSEIAAESLFGAEGLSFSIGLDQSLVDATAQIVELASKLAE